VILAVLKRAFPKYGFHAEEAGMLQERDRMWYIDPLDGTTNYIHEYPMFSISIGLAQEGRPIAGVVMDPVHNEVFRAEKGKGAYLNKKRIYVSRTKKLKDAFLTTGFPFRERRHFGPYQKSFERLFYRTSSIRRGGSAALDLCYTACGRADGFWEYGLSEWDVAAGIVIIEEAGGVVTNFKGKQHELDCGNIAAGNSAIHRGLISVLKKIRF